MSTTREITEKGDPQLSFSFVSEPPPPGSGGHLLSKPLFDHPSKPRILKMVRIARAFFPELDGIPLKIGLARGAYGYASLEEPAIWLNPRRLSYQTISHELIHLLQVRGEIPKGERSCDLYSLARDKLLVDAAPVYLDIPEVLVAEDGGLKPGASRLLHETAVEALKRRASGERQYIRWFEKRISGEAGSFSAEK